jgi:hypothetical protein
MLAVMCKGVDVEIPWHEMRAAAVIDSHTIRCLCSRGLA